MGLYARVIGLRVHATSHHYTITLACSHASPCKTVHVLFSMSICMIPAWYPLLKWEPLHRQMSNSFRQIQCDSFDLMCFPFPHSFPCFAAFFLFPLVFTRPFPETQYATWARGFWALGTYNNLAPQAAHWDEVTHTGRHVNVRRDGCMEWVQRCVHLQPVMGAINSNDVTVVQYRVGGYYHQRAMAWPQAKALQSAKVPWCKISHTTAGLAALLCSSSANTQ